VVQRTDCCSRGYHSYYFYLRRLGSFHFELFLVFLFILCWFGFYNLPAANH